MHGESWTFRALPHNPSVAAVTRRQHATGTHTPASSHIALSPQFAADDLLTLQTADSSLRTMEAHIFDPLTHPISTSDLNMSSELRTLHSIKHMLHLRDGVLTYDLNLVTAYTTHQYLEELHQHLRMTVAFTQQQLQQSAEG